MILLSMWSLGAFAQMPKPNLLIFLSEDCPVSQHMVRELQALQEFSEEITLKAVFPMRYSTTESVEKWMQENQLEQFEWILDSTHIYVHRYKPRVVPEAVFLTVNSEMILYKGRITDAFHKVGRRKHGKVSRDLYTYISDYLEGSQEVIPVTNQAIGCLIVVRE